MENQQSSDLEDHDLMIPVIGNNCTCFNYFSVWGVLAANRGIATRVHVIIYVITLGLDTILPSRVLSTLVPGSDLQFLCTEYGQSQRGVGNRQACCFNQARWHFTGCLIKA